MGRVDAVGAVIAAAVNRQPDRRTDCEFPLLVLTIGANSGRMDEISRLSTHF